MRFVAKVIGVGVDLTAQLMLVASYATRYVAGVLVTVADRLEEEMTPPEPPRPSAPPPSAMAPEGSVPPSYGDRPPVAPE